MEQRQCPRCLHPDDQMHSILHCKHPDLADLCRTALFELHSTAQYCCGSSPLTPCLLFSAPQGSVSSPVYRSHLARHLDHNVLHDCLHFLPSSDYLPPHLLDCTPLWANYRTSPASFIAISVSYIALLYGSLCNPRPCLRQLLPRHSDSCTFQHNKHISYIFKTIL